MFRGIFYFILTFYFVFQMKNYSSNSVSLFNFEHEVEFGNMIRGIKLFLTN